MEGFASINPPHKRLKSIVTPQVGMVIVARIGKIAISNEGSAVNAASRSTKGQGEPVDGCKLFPATSG